MKNVNWAATALLACLAGAASAADGTPRLSAVIEIGAKGVKAVVVSAVPLGGDAFRYERKYARTCNTTLSALDDKGAFSAGAIKDTADAVKRFDREMRAAHKVPADRIMLVASSGLPRARNMKALVDAIKKAVGKELLLMGRDQEVPLNILGVLPKEVQDEALFFDLGSGGLGGGYFEPASEAHVSVFRTVYVRCGTVTFTNKCQARRGHKTLPQVAAELAKEITKDLERQVARKPGLVNRDTVYLNGGAVWAMVTILRPEKCEENLVELQAADIDRFLALLAKTPGAFPTVDLGGLPAGLQLKAKKNLKAVRDTFTPANLVAAATLLKSLSTAYDFKAKGKRLFFRRDGYIGWIAALAESHARGRKLPGD